MEETVDVKLFDVVPDIVFMDDLLSSIETEACRRRLPKDKRGFGSYSIKGHERLNKFDYVNEYLQRKDHE